jgi:hypothetical protein
MLAEVETLGRYEKTHRRRPVAAVETFTALVRARLLLLWRLFFGGDFCPVQQKTTISKE